MDDRFEFDAPRFYDFAAMVSSNCSPGQATETWFATQGPSGEDVVDYYAASNGAQSTPTFYGSMAESCVSSCLPLLSFEALFRACCNIHLIILICVVESYCIAVVGNHLLDHHCFFLYYRYSTMTFCAVPRSNLSCLNRTVNKFT